MKDEQIKEQSEYIKNKLPDILKNIDEKKDEFLCKEGIDTYCDYGNTACFTYAANVHCKERLISFRIGITAYPYVEREDEK